MTPRRPVTVTAIEEGVRRPVRRWLPLVAVALVAPSFRQQPPGPSMIVAPQSGPTGTTVTVQLTGFLDECAVSFDDVEMVRATGCEHATLSFVVPAAAVEGDHQIRAGGATAAQPGIETIGLATALREGTFQVTVTTTTVTPTTAPPPASTAPPPTVSPSSAVFPVIRDDRSTSAVEAGATVSMPNGIVGACPPRQVALTRFALDPVRGRPATAVTAATSWGTDSGMCTDVRSLRVLFDGEPLTGQPPAAGTSGSFALMVPEDAEVGRHRVALVTADDTSIELATVAFEVESADDGPGPARAFLLIGVVAALGVLAAMGVRRRRGRGDLDGGSAPPAPRSRGSSGAAAGSGPESWRTALKAAYFVAGKDGEEIYAFAAGSRDPEMRKTVEYSLYLLWRRDPKAVYEVLGALADRVGPFPIGRTSRILKTLTDTSITIYINQPQNLEMAGEVSKLWSKALKERLRMDRRRWLQPALVPVLSSVFARRVLETALLGQHPKRFFHADPRLRATFARVAPLADPTVPLDGKAVSDDLVALLESRINLHSVLAALTLVIHAANDFEATEPLVRELHQRVDAHGRLWLLYAFSVLLPGTPRAWVPLLEDLTGELIERDRETFMTRGGGQFRDFDIALLPLGLAYAKARDIQGMPCIDSVLAEAIAQKDWLFVTRVVEGLAPIGFHYAEVLFGTLRPVMGALLGDPTARDALASTLAATRTLWFDEADLFLREMGASREFRQEVASRTKTERITRLVAWLGIYNNAVHESLEYPVMRKELLLGGLEGLATASSSSRFVRRYTRRFLDLLHQADYEPIKWTESPVVGAIADRPEVAGA